MRQIETMSRRWRPPPALIGAAARMLFGTKSRLALYEQLQQVSGSGFREHESVAMIWKIVTRNGQRGRLSPTAMFCEESMFALRQEGRTLPEVVLRWAGTFERPLLVAAAAGGGTPELYEEIARQLKKRLEIRGTLMELFGNLAVLLGGIIASALFLAYYFVPQITAFIDPAELRGSAGGLVSLALAFGDLWPLLCGGLLLVCIATVIALPRLTGRARDVLDRFEPFAIYRELTGGMFLVGAAALFRTGMTERDALQALRRAATPYLAGHIRRLEKIDASFGDRLYRLAGNWPDYHAKAAAAFGAQQHDSTRLYSRIGDELVARTRGRCARLARLSGWIANFALAALIIWILVATNDISASFLATRR